MRHSTAGAATAPRPALTTVRRDGRDTNSVMLTSLDSIARRVVLARLLEMLQDFCPQRRLLLRCPFAEAFAALEAQLAVRHELFQIGRGARPALDRRQHGLVDGEREVRADHVGIFQRTETRQPGAE